MTGLGTIGLGTGFDLAGLFPAYSLRTSCFLIGFSRGGIFTPLGNTIYNNISHSTGT